MTSDDILFFIWAEIVSMHCHCQIQIANILSYYIGYKKFLEKVRAV